MLKTSWMFRCFVLTVVAAIASAPARAQGQAAASAAITSGGPGATLVVFGGVTGRGANLSEAAGDALRRVEERLAEVGLTRGDVLRVRAALAPSTAGDGAFAEWERAFAAFFAPARPAATSIQVSALPDPSAHLVLDVVTAYPPGRGPSAGQAGRAGGNAHIRYVGASANPTAIVRPEGGLFLASGVLPNRGALADPDAMDAQVRSSWDRVMSNLAEAGLGPQDVFFVRAMPTPQPGRQEVDFGAWPAVRAEVRPPAAGDGPAYVAWAAPGFRARRVYVELEMWAAAPSRPAPALHAVESHPTLRVFGGGSSAIPNGVLVAGDAELLWLAAITSPYAAGMHDEAVGALLALRNRLEAVGAGLQDVAELRVYVVAPDDVFDREWAAWNEAYARFFNHPRLNPHRPARTTYAVEALPAGRRVMLEAVVARRPGEPR